ncbi:MAG: transglutaminase [Acidobacteria bacterium OLB17]|nr:MAG: transglutaminase [Acidobacteria bacterium OLB17]MCZ2389445.1 DUF3488 and transglutaminase-like domain-containing protein [Acidobacteriota bacterium]
MAQERLLQALSYAVACCGFLTLWVSGTFGILATVLYLGAIALAWRLEGTRWQISERAGTVMIVLALPAFYLAWRLQAIPVHGVENAVAGMLARMILALSAIKLLQRKKDRDWVFLHLMTFFSVLLAAGLSISPLYLASFILYIIVVVATIVVWENVSSARRTRLRKAARKDSPADHPSLTKLAGVSLAIVSFTVFLAVPLFFVLPRVGGAGFGGSDGGVATYSGFSDTVRLGGIGRIQQSDRVVMRVQTAPSELAGADGYYRGVALDTFDGLSWSKSRPQSRETLLAAPDDRIVIDDRKPYSQLVEQEIYLEPIDTPILFGQPRILEVTSGVSALYRDSYESLAYSRTGERMSYTVVSDISTPTAAQLRMDNAPYGHDIERYLELPEHYDKRIFSLAQTVTQKAADRYGKALAVRDYLRSSYGYTLEQKAGGDQPLSDFLFNVREGHCEYFATAMAIMLRTQGIATRVVNGFHGGDYNSASGVTVVRQRNAHSWVEVYFPREGQWVLFDPTPAAGRNLGGGGFSGLTGQISKYLDALETVWIQYFVAFDSHGQAAISRSVRASAREADSALTALLAETARTIADWWRDIRGDSGQAARAWAITYFAVGLLLLAALILLLRQAVRVLKVRGQHWRRRLFGARSENPDADAIFFELVQMLERKGYVRRHSQTPLEFARSVPFPEVGKVTSLYNRIRFAGDKSAARDLRNEARGLLAELERSLQSS